METVADVVAPPNQEGTKATVLRWSKSVGDRILKDEPLLELETDKVTVEIASPASGELVEILVAPDREVLPGQVLARVRLEAGTAPAEPPAPAGDGTAAAADGAPPDERILLSPAVRRLLAQHGIGAGEIAGTGRDGRVTAVDVERHARAAASRLPHTPIRRRIAEHMVKSMTQAPHVTTLFEADLTRVIAHRTAHAAEFERRGTRATLTAYFIAACAQSLPAHPQVNATFHEDALELHADANIGVGTALGGGGVIVPVLQRAQDLDLFGIAERLSRLVSAARAGTLRPADVQGGTFTISNHGVSGSLLAAPIVINQPQVAILGIGKVERRVCALPVEGAEVIAVRSMCYLTLTIDHRAIDAFQANAFLSSVVAALEGWSTDRSAA